jgi:hypothetical protein
LTNQYVGDALGQLTSVTQTSQSGGNSVTAKRTTYQYDAASELTDLRRDNSTSVCDTHARAFPGGPPTVRRSMAVKGRIGSEQQTRSPPTNGTQIDETAIYQEWWYRGVMDICPPLRTHTRETGSAAPNPSDFAVGTLGGSAWIVGCDRSQSGGQTFEDAGLLMCAAH